MIKSIKLKLILTYNIFLTSLMFSFGLILFFSFKNIQIKKMDKMIYDGAYFFKEELKTDTLEYFTKKNLSFENLTFNQIKNDIPKETSDYIIEEFEDEVSEIFFMTKAYVQFSKLPNNNQLSSSIILKSESLKNKSFTLANINDKRFSNKSFFINTNKNFFSDHVRIINILIKDIDKNTYLLQIGLSLEKMNDSLNNLFLILLMFFPILIFIISIFGYLFVKKSFSPIKKMVELTNKITVNDLSLRLTNIESNDEIGDLSNTLNEMISRLESSFNQIKQFSGDVSHELKTPITKLITNAEVALRKPRTIEEYNITLKNIIKDSLQLKKIIDNLFFLTKLDSHNINLDYHNFSLSQLILENIEKINTKAINKKISIIINNLDEIIFNGHKETLRILIDNLLNNAIRYNFDNSKIIISLSKDESNIYLSISDTGIGIPQENLPYIFDRFYCVSPSRVKKYGGSGLGLSIAKKIADLHKGTITIESKEKKGSKFTLILPYKNSL